MLPPPSLCTFFFHLLLVISLLPSLLSVILSILLFCLLTLSRREDSDPSPPPHCCMPRAWVPAPYPFDSTVPASHSPGCLLFPECSHCVALRGMVSSSPGLWIYVTEKLHGMHLSGVRCVWPSSKPWGRNASITNRVNRRQLKQGDAYKARCIQESIM